jgi:hypothetical protein
MYSLRRTDQTYPPFTINVSPIILLARARNFKGLQAMAIATGGFLIGSQLGLVMGAMASVRTIQSIPNFKRVMNIVQEVRYMTLDAI